MLHAAGVTGINATALAVVGTPVVGLAANLLVVSSVTGYSRELEGEADAQGYKRLVAAGYDPREAPKLFKLMMDEVKASGVDEPFFFSTHPALEDRYDNYLRLSKDAPAPKDPPPDRYLATFAELRLAQRRLGLLARLDPRRAHEDDGVVYPVVLEAALGLEVLGQDAQRARVLAVEECLVAVGLDAFAPMFAHAAGPPCAGRFRHARSLARQSRQVARSRFSSLL